MTRDLWFFPLVCGAEDLALAEQLLSGEERQRASRFRFDTHRRRFIVRRAMRRIVLGQLTATPPDAVRFDASDTGKPALGGSGSGLEFSTSHSDDLGLLATSGSAVGADIESVGRTIDHLRFAAHHFTDEEYGEIARHRGDSLRIAFFNCWTAKEGYLKALGLGLTRSLKSFSVQCAPGKRPGLIRDADDPSASARWQFSRYGDGVAIATVVTAAGGGAPETVIHTLAPDTLAARVPVEVATPGRWQES